MSLYVSKYKVIEELGGLGGGARNMHAMSREGGYERG